MKSDLEKLYSHIADIEVAMMTTRRADGHLESRAMANQKPAGGADLSAALQEHLRFALDIYGPLTVHWFWQTPPDFPGPPWCSELDWAVADRAMAR